MSLIETLPDCHEGDPGLLPPGESLAAQAVSPSGSDTMANTSSVLARAPTGLLARTTPVHGARSHRLACSIRSSCGPLAQFRNRPPGTVSCAYQVAIQ